MSHSTAKPGLAAGDPVRIADAEPGTPDPKALVYYDYYRNLTGVVIKAYDDGTVAIAIDRAALPTEVRERHEVGEKLHRDRWLNNLSEEDRGRLTQKEQKFSLRYTILVDSRHVVPEKAGGDSGGRSRPAPAKSAVAADPLASRPSSSDLDAAEESYLRSKQDGNGR